MTAYTLPVNGAASDERKPTEMPTTRGLAARSVDLHGDQFLSDAHRVFERPEKASERQRHPHILDSPKDPQTAISEI